MSELPRLLIRLAALSALLWAFAPRVEAYLDPGTGSALLQGVIGGLAVAAGVVAHYWHRVKAMFSRRTPPDGVGQTDA